MPPLREASCCIRHVMTSVVLVQLLLLAAAGSTAASNDATVTAAGDDGEPTEMYICYLCVGRDVMLIRRCPIYWDECHLVCYAPHATAAAAAVSGADIDAPSPSRPGIPGEKLHEDDYYDDQCYVMKLYQNGSYVIVTTLNCRAAARCGLSCGGGDGADDGRALAVHGATPAAPQGVLPLLPSHFTNFQRCGSQQTTRKRNMSRAPTTRSSYSASSRP
ncbi:hypothetical protein ABZP36_003805 [Zizania latifolia]